jgi:glycosyltransferase involved in cell wall biosynthesis
MAERIRLSICVPSRNRQRYFQQTIVDLLDSARTDVEFVFADNSDDPAVINDFMQSHSRDNRVRYLPSEPSVLSMQQNWERCLAASTGDWVSIIGDDDLIDPDLIDALKIAQGLKPDLEAFGWANLRYSWVNAESRIHNVRIPMAGSFHDMPPELVRRRAFRWDDAGASITSGFSVYHSALSRPLLERMHARFGGRYFGHPVVDYDSALKAAALGRAFVYCARPLSIFGACPEANSSALYNLARLRDSQAQFNREAGRDTNADPWLADFPFPASLGLTACVGQIQQWLAHVHDVPMQPGWEANFVRACAKTCAGFSDRSDFDLVAGQYRKALTAWKGGMHLRHFDPQYVPAVHGEVFTGLNEGNLYVNDRIGGATSPTGFYRAVNDLLEPPGRLSGPLHGMKMVPRAA